jgi:hypothetical protein
LAKTLSVALKIGIPIPSKRGYFEKIYITLSNKERRLWKKSKNY